MKHICIISLLILSSTSCFCQTDSIQIDNLNYYDSLYYHDSIPFSGIAIRNEQGDYKTEMHNGIWTIKNGRLHGMVKNRNGILMFSNGIPNGIIRLYESSIPISISNNTYITDSIIMKWDMGKLKECAIGKEDTIRINFQSRKYFVKTKKIDKTNCSGKNKTYSVYELKKTIPKGFYVINYFNKKLNYHSWQSGTLINGEKHGVWTSYDSTRVLQEDYYITGNLFYQKSYGENQKISEFNYLSFSRLGNPIIMN